MVSIKYKNAYLKDSCSIVGPIEKNSKLKGFDFYMNDYYYKEKTFEKAETKMQKTVIENLILKNFMKLIETSLSLTFHILL